MWRHRELLCALAVGALCYDHWCGAAEGAGLGIQFLKHLQRTKLLLHLVDIAPIDTNVDPADAFAAIEKELQKFSADLTTKPRWLVINKTDLLLDEELAEARENLLAKLEWSGPVFEVSAETGAGTEEMGQAVIRELEEMAELEAEDAAEI